MTYRRAECLTAAGFVLLSILGWFQIRDLPTDARMFPATLLAVIGVLSSMMLIRGLIGSAAHLSDEAAQNWRFAISFKRMAIGFGMLAVYFLVLPFVGFFTSSFVFVLCVAVGAGYHNMRALVLAASGFCLFVYLIFVALFERPLPKEFFATLLTASS